MKSLLLLFSCLTLVSTKAYSQSQVLMNKEKTLFQFNRIEIGIKLKDDIESKVQSFLNSGKSGEKINPFNYNELKIESQFYFEDSISQPNYKPIVRYGFYYRDYERNVKNDSWEMKSTEYNYRARFAPPYTGKWKVKTFVKVNNNNEKITMNELSFQVHSAGTNFGPVLRRHTGTSNDRYLVYAKTGETFFANSLNLAWASLDKLHAHDYFTYEKWINSIAASKVNFIQIGAFAWNYGIEWEQMGNYSQRMPNAWELDALMDLCERKNIYVNLALSIHDEFMLPTELGWNHDNNGWDNNPYSTANQNIDKEIKQPLDFFVNTTAKTFFKQRLFYYCARWGYSPQLIIYELNTEIDNALKSANYNKDPEVRKKVLAWFIEMRDFLKNELYTDRMISGSYTQSGQTDNIKERIFSEADVVLLHHYGTRIATNWADRSKKADIMLQSPYTKNKPVLYDEMGASFPTLDNCSDITFHTNVWTTAMTGCFGTGMNWWWDNGILLKGYERNFLALDVFFKGEQLAYKNFTYNKKKTNGLGKKINSKTRYEMYYLVNKDKDLVLGYVHNLTYFWANQKSTNECIKKCIEENGKHIDKGDDLNYRKEAEADSYTGTFKNYRTETIKLSGLKPNASFTIRYFSTETGKIVKEETVKTKSSGAVEVTLSTETLSSVYGDLAFKVLLIR